MNDIAKRKEADMLIDDSDIQMIMMMVMMVVMMSMFMTPLLQQSQAQTAALQAQAYSGQEDPRNIHATNRLSWINLVYDYPFTPWISAYFINEKDSPSAVEIGINYPDDRFTIKPGETITVARSGAEERIKIIYFLCRPGLDADVRVTGVY